MREEILRFGPWAVPFLVLLSGLAMENRVAFTRGHVGASNPPAQASAPRSRFRSLLDEARARVPAVTVKDLAARLARGDRPAHLIDVREEWEWKAGRLPGAKHLSKGVIERDIEKLVMDPSAEIVLYCESGGRSLLAAENLRRMGYANVFSLEGGYRAWLAAGRPSGYRS